MAKPIVMTVMSFSIVTLSLSRLLSVCLHQLAGDESNPNWSDTALHHIPWIAVFKVMCDTLLLSNESTL
jgi:hypothetical protein